MVNSYSEKSSLSINKLIEDNLELVKKIAWQIYGRVQRAVEIEDLIQQGMEGLVSSAQKYSPKEGVTFQQYAQLRIRGSIIDFLRNKINISAKIERIEYDPNRTSYIALVKYDDEVKNYILCPQGLKVGDKITSGDNVDIKIGNNIYLKICALEMPIYKK